MSDDHGHSEPIGWKERGVKVIPGDRLDPYTAQTPGMNRAAAINLARGGAEDLGRHGQDPPQRQDRRASSRRPRKRHLRPEGPRPDALGREVAEARPGDFIFVPPWVPRQEINASTDEPLDCVLVRSDTEAAVVNLDIERVARGVPAGLVR